MAGSFASPAGAAAASFAGAAVSCAGAGAAARSAARAAMVMMLVFIIVLGPDGARPSMELPGCTAGASALARLDRLHVDLARDLGIEGDGGLADLDDVRGRALVEPERVPGITPSAASRSMRSWNLGAMKTIRPTAPSSKVRSPVTSGRTVFW